jgi:peptidoglycan/LPS O-acetylase OafA/YrhL
MGGFLAAGLWQRRKGVEFLKHRTQRLLIPLALAIFLVLPADMYVWLAGWVTEGLIPLRKMRSIKLPDPLSSQFWGVAHLWYLECLWALSVCAWAILTIRQRWHDRPRATLSISRRSGRFDKLLDASRWPMLICGAFVSGLLLAREPQILIGFQQRWWPSPTMTLFYATFFVAGWRWPKADANPTSRPEFGHRLMLAFAFFPVLFVLIRWHVDRPLPAPLLPFLTIPYALFGWLTATGLFGLATRPSSGVASRPVRYVAEASFWMYLVHHPLVGLTQLAMLRTSWPAEVRFAIAFSTGVWLSLGTYGVFVRGTWLGQLLNGSGRRLPESVPQPTTDQATPIRRAA